MAVVRLIAGSLASSLALLTIVATQGMSGHVSADLLVLGYGGGWFLLFGIATTIQRTTGEGVLERADPRFPEALFPFRFSGGTIYPCDWRAKRLFDGEADEVWSKYSVLVLEPLKKGTAAAG